MKGPKKAYKEITTDLKVTAMRIAAGDTTVFTRTDKIIAVAVMFLVTVLMFAASTCFGADLFDQIKNQFNAFYGKLAGLATIVAATCIIGGFLWTMVSPGQKSSQVPIAWIKKVLFCYFLILILGGIFSMLKTMTAGQGFSPENP